MNFDFELILFSLVALTGTVALVDWLFLSRKRTNQRSAAVDYARSYFPMLLMVLSIRSFAFEPRRIPTGSLKPTLLVGDLILVNKFTYGIRLPVLHTKIISLNEPKRGDIVVFRAPAIDGRDLVKRVIGVPGDRIHYSDKVLYINGHKMDQSFVGYARDQHDDTASWDVTQKQENLFGIKHDIYQIEERGNDNFDAVVPSGHYFMMGDNRDDSADSRYWGFLPEESIIGRATHTIVSFDNVTHPVRWERTAQRII